MGFCCLKSLQQVPFLKSESAEGLDPPDHKEMGKSLGPLLKSQRPPLSCLAWLQALICSVPFPVAREGAQRGNE